MKQKLIVMAFMLFSALLKSQSVPMALEDWKTTDGTQNFFFKNAIATDPSGNTIIAGATMSNGFPDILVAKYSSAGAQLWIKQFPGATNGIDFAAGLTVTNTDVYITGAITNNSVTLLTECITMRLASSTGSVVWSSTYIGAAGIADLGKSININGSGDVFVTGGSYNSNFNTDFLTIKYDGATGTQLWDNTWDYTAGLNDAAYKVNFSGSNVIVGGAVTDGVNTYKYAALTLSQSTGSLLATSIGAGVTTTSVDAVTDVITDNAGYIIIAGSMDVVGQGTNFFVQKLDPANLASVWIYSWNGAGSMNDYVKGISVDASNNVYLSGYTSTSGQGRDIVAIKLNSSGTQQWSQTINGSFNGDDEAGDIAVDASGNSYITGYTTKSTNNSNYYTTKLNSSGTKIWEKETEGNGLNTTATNIELDLMNNIIITGQSEMSPGNYEFLTVKYVQRDVITPTDLNGETPALNFRYYRNSGQLTAATSTITLVPDVKFYTNNTYPSFYFKSNSQSFVFAKIDTVIATNDTLHRIDLDFNNNTAIGTYPMEAQDNGYLNYFLAQTGDKGVTNVKGNQRLITPNLYPNIDLMCSSNQNGIKYYFIVKPGGDIRDIDLEFTGASSFSLNGTTNALTINSSIGSLTYDRPTVYQLTAGNATVAVTGWTADWQTNGASNKYKFNHGAYTNSLTLIIEVDQGNVLSSSAAINNLNWSTYYGGAGGEDYGYSIKNDNAGNIYIGGYSTNPSFPVTTGAYQTTYAAGDNSNGILIKFNAARQLQWATYFGGTNIDQIKSIAFDNVTTQIYACGYSWSSDFPIKNKSGANVSGPFKGYSDAFVSSFNTSGMLTWSNLFGTPSDERAYSIYCDNSGNKYLVGYSDVNLSLTNAASYYMQSTYGGGVSDGFIAKYTSSDQLDWMTYYGGNAEDYAMSVTGDASGNIFVWGNTSSTTFNTYNPGSGAVYNTTNKGATDFFLLKFNSSGSRLWATLYGGDGDDWAAEDDGIVAVGSDIYCFGTTFSTNLPLKVYGSTPTNNLNGSQDCYIVCFNNAYTEKWATYFGGSNEDYAGGITKDVNNNIIITGSTASSNFVNTTPSGFYSQSFAGPLGLPTGVFAGGDAFITSFSNVTLAPAWSTFIGGNNHDVGYGISATSNNKLFITGVSLSISTPYPVVAPANTYNYTPTSATGNGDIIISEFNISNTPVLINEYNNQDNSFIYPNPFINAINIEGFKDKMKFEVFDLLGKLVIENTLKVDQNFVNLSILKSGVYLFKIISNNGDYKTFKIIKQD